MARVFAGGFLSYIAGKRNEALGIGRYNLFFEKSSYKCKAFGSELFDSSSKSDSGFGWPSFDRGDPRSENHQAIGPLPRHRRNPSGTST